MNKLFSIINNIFTARDNESISLTKLMGITGVVAMSYKFITGDSSDFSAFGTGISLIIAALAAKYMVEK